MKMPFRSFPNPGIPKMPHSLQGSSLLSSAVHIQWLELDLMGEVHPEHLNFLNVTSATVMGIVTAGFSIFYKAIAEMGKDVSRRVEIEFSNSSVLKGHWGLG